MIKTVLLFNEEEKNDNSNQEEDEYEEAENAEDYKTIYHFMYHKRGA